MAKLGIALGSGPRGRGFESRHSDHIENATLPGGIFYVDAVMGFERPLRKHAGGMFLGRGRIHRFRNAPGTGVGIKRSWSQKRVICEHL